MKSIQEFKDCKLEANALSLVSGSLADAASYCIHHEEFTDDEGITLFWINTQTDDNGNVTKEWMDID